ncbi:MAG: ABC transporter substrate-binding protein, partial [Gammaproteobacteria bacterium]|nr:ABC transporter substrate-binding protein [Gammaproteobacteria bacterium]
IRNHLKIGAFTPTPGVKWLARYGMTEQTVAFVAMSGDPDAYPGQVLEKELAKGQLDAAVIWGPMAGYFARRVKGEELVVIPLQSEPGIQFDFAIAAGVRYGDGERKRLLEDLMIKTAAPIQEILAEYNVPLLDIESDADSAESSDDD